MNRDPSQPNSVPRVKHVKAKHNYSSLNKHGLQSLKVPKVKSRIKTGGRNTPTTPGSGNWLVELLNKFVGEEQSKDEQGKDGQLLQTGGKVTGKGGQEGVVSNNRTNEQSDVIANRHKQWNRLPSPQKRESEQ